jgi:hypothetical protein
MAYLITVRSTKPDGYFKSHILNSALKCLVQHINTWLASLLSPTPTPAVPSGCSGTSCGPGHAQFLVHSLLIAASDSVWRTLEVSVRREEKASKESSY